MRLRRGWRQKDVAARAGVSPSLVSLIERGHLGRLSIDALRAVAAVLDIRLDLVARWRGGELDRLLNSRHSALEDAVARWLGEIGGWVLVPEVSFAVFGERGWIDLLAWHASSRTLMVIEIKTEVIDLQELIGLVDRKVRLARRIGGERGWSPIVVAAWVVVADGPTNRRRVAAHRALVRAAFPVDGRFMRKWLKKPVGGACALSFFSNSNGRSVKPAFAGRQRVRLPKSTTTERAQSPGEAQPV